MSDPFVRCGVPDYIRRRPTLRVSASGPEFVANTVRTWLARIGAKTLLVEQGSASENGYIQSFNGKLCDELVDREIFDTLLEAKVLIERWREDYNAAPIARWPTVPRPRTRCCLQRLVPLRSTSR